MISTMKIRKKKNKKNENERRNRKSSSSMIHKRKEYQSTHYFNDDTEQKLLEYIDEKDSKKKEIIYRDHLHGPLSKLVENIIHTFKFKSFYDDYEDLKQEVLSFLITRLDKFDQKVSKAYTFLSIIAKRYLILNSQINYKKIKSKEDVMMADFDKTIFNEECSKILRTEEMIDYYDFFISYLEENKKRFCKNEMDEKIMNSLIKILNSGDDKNDIDNRKTLCKKIKEDVGCANSSMITKVFNMIKSKNPEIRKKYTEKEKK